jgi:hypothetical protein
MRRVSPIARLLAYEQGLCILVGSDATVPMQCHARSCIVECPMWESTCTLSDTDARVGCCVNPARDILRADSRGSHGSSVAACCTDHQPQYQLYYAASCTDCGCRIGVRDPHVRVPSRNERHPLRRGRVLLHVLERVRDRFCVSTGCAFCRQVAESYAAVPIICLAGSDVGEKGGEGRGACTSPRALGAILMLRLCA